MCTSQRHPAATLETAPLFTLMCLYIRRASGGTKHCVLPSLTFAEAFSTAFPVMYNTVRLFIVFGEYCDEDINGGQKIGYGGSPNTPRVDKALGPGANVSPSEHAGPNNTITTYRRRPAVCLYLYVLYSRWRVVKQTYH